MDEFPGLHHELEQARAATQRGAYLVPRYRRYASGRQLATQTPMQRRILAGLLSNPHTDNICFMVLQAHAARLRVERFTVSPSANDSQSGAAAEAVTTALATIWLYAAGPLLQERTKWAALRDGNAAIALAWDAMAARVRLVREPWWDGSRGLWVEYDEEDRPVRAVKDWVDGRGRQRRVVWLPDAILRFIRGAGFGGADSSGWAPYPLDPGDPASWRAAWVDPATGAPLGLPVVHFPNSSIPDDSPDRDPHYGESLLAGGVLGLQDQINDLQADLSAAARMTGYQMYYGTGVGTDEDGMPTRFQVEPGAFFSIPGPGSMGTLTAGSLAELERGHGIKLSAVSRNTATPIHEITGGNWPSGDALEQAEAPLIAVSLARQAAFGPAWGAVLHKATILLNAFARQRLDLDAAIRPVWTDPRLLTPQIQATIAATLAPFVSEEETLRTLGKTPEEVTQIMQERAGNAAQGLTLDQLIPNNSPVTNGAGGTNGRSA